MSIYALPGTRQPCGSSDHMADRGRVQPRHGYDAARGHVLVVDDDPAIRPPDLRIISQQNGRKDRLGDGPFEVALNGLAGIQARLILDRHLGQDKGSISPGNCLRSDVRSIRTGRSRDEKLTAVALETRCRPLPHQAVQHPRIVCPVPRRGAAP